MKLIICSFFQLLIFYLFRAILYVERPIHFVKCMLNFPIIYLIHFCYLNFKINKGKYFSTILHLIYISWINLLFWIGKTFSSLPSFFDRIQNGSISLPRKWHRLVTHGPALHCSSFPSAESHDCVFGMKARSTYSVNANWIRSNYQALIFSVKVRVETFWLSVEDYPMWLWQNMFILLWFPGFWNIRFWLFIYFLKDAMTFIEWGFKNCN